MQTPTIELIYQHASIRRYKSDPVDRNLVEEIVAAGQRASTSSNLQTYSVIAVGDREKRNRLAELCGNQEQIRQAPIFLAWCADLSRLDRICVRRGYEQVTEHVESFLVSTVDAALAMQNAALASESHGLGMCSIGAIRNRPRDVIALLGLPELVFPISGMTLGWPDVEPRIRPRLPLNAVLHWESYSKHGEEEAIRQYDESMIATGIYSGRQASGKGQKAAVSEYGWAEHSARRASLALRTDLRQILAEQGFLLR
ncbi:MAG: NADPH-dependent oxidoreductase [Chloroflexota bacterium]|nr:MAG: NADPH-dependent oxidoreductase [Chloroflexota bacterium]